MSQLYYTATNSAWGWSGGITINYTTSYNSVTNQTIITFSESLYKYFGKSGSWSEANTDITVTATDSGNSATANLYYAGNTNGGNSDYKATPNPTAITVQHNSTSGEKSIAISGSTTIHAILSNNSSTYVDVPGSGSVTVTSGTHYLERTLSISAENATVVCQRTSSPAGADTGTLTNGETIYDSDVLKFTFSAKTGYGIESALLNNKAITNGATHTVSGDVSVAVIATAISFTLTINQGEGTIIAVNRTSSPKASASLGLLSNGDPIYHSDILNITFNVEFGYDLLTQTINGEPASDQDYAVLQNVIVAATAEKTGLVYIDNGSGWEAYEIWIDNGTSWDLYIPYIDDGVAWQPYS